MSDAADTSEPPGAAPTTGAGSPRAKTPAGADTSKSASPSADPSRADDEGPTTDVKGDSEAETVVLPGKEDKATSPQRRAIKHEGTDDSKPSSKRVSDILAGKSKDSSEHDGEARAKKSGKDLTATSSNLSSTRSSPSPDARVTSRAGSESVHSKSKSHPDSDAVSRTSHSRKRKIASEDGDEKSHKRRQKRDASLESGANGVTADRDRREKTKSSNPRSESPQPRTRHRAQSLKGQGSSSTQKRNKPPPLFVGSRSKTNEEDSSEGSASPHSAAPHRRRLVSAGEGSATSPAKMPPHKKLRDKSGRTILARACDSEDFEAVRSRLQERPEDLDVADYAGNTPLQIASLSGRHEVVKILLEAGCKTECKNVDQDTPLIDAVENGHLAVIKLLLDAGLNPRQTNAKGEELMDLLKSDADDYEEIKKLLSKARDSRRRVSDDHQTHHTGRESATAQSPRESNMNSPPPLASASRRRTARGEATRNDLLWVNPTRDNLRNKARVGDDTAVNHILSMSPSVADVESVLAAARGSHELSLSLILAMGAPPVNPDPDPIPGERNSQSTPMLAAIGRGNLRVIELLLEQPGFNPSRRLFQGKAYHEVARDRKGANWEQEFRILKAAYDRQKGRSSTGNSPSNSKKSKAEVSGSPDQERSRTKSDAKEALERKKSNSESRRPTSRSDPRTESPERSRQHTKKHLRVPSKPSSREHSIAVSDREASPLPKSSEKKARRSLSDTEAPEAEVQKPRKRLISKRDLNEGDRQRRASMVSVGSASSQDHAKRLAREQSSQKIKRDDKRDELKKEDSRDAIRSSKSDSARKRSRPETTSPESTQRDTVSPDAAKKAKRIRVESEPKPKKKVETDAIGSRHKSPSATALNKDSKSTKRSSSASRKLSPSAPANADSAMAKIKEEPDASGSQLQKEAQDAADAEKEHKEKARKQAEKAEKAEKVRREQEEAERVAREEAAARAAEQLRREEAERKLKAEQEEAERKAKAEKEEAERRAREEEEARLEKKRQEEEQARKQAERERLRKEQEEMQARRRKEQEEKERLAREKKQQEEERRRREALPPALRIAAELTSEQVKQPSEVLHWLPLYTAESQQLDIPCDETSKHERWITNLQAAPILGVTDLDLSQYTAWTKHPASDGQRISLWRILRRKLARYQMPEFGPADHQKEFQLDAEAREKFDALKSIFWIRLSDLLDIVPRHPHLNGIDLKCCAMVIRPVPSTAGKMNGGGSISNGSMAMPNGYH